MDLGKIIAIYNAQDGVEYCFENINKKLNLKTLQINFLLDN
jgi:hypothetical protein